MRGGEKNEEKSLDEMITTCDICGKTIIGVENFINAGDKVVCYTVANGETDPEIVKRYGSISERFEVFGGYDTDVAVNKIANGLSISREMRAQLFDSLSGGERTRVNLARLLLEETDILLLDEPLAALDLKLRKDMQVELKNIQKSHLI